MTRITASPSNINFKNVSDHPVQLTVKDENGADSTHSKTLRYSSNNTSVAEVSHDGLVTPKGAGSADIKIEASDNPGVHTSVNVSVAGSTAATA